MCHSGGILTSSSQPLIPSILVSILTSGKGEEWKEVRVGNLH
jgi:hypothetical protein